MATAKTTKTSSSGSGKNPKAAASSVANKKTAATKTASKANGNGRSAAAKTGGSNKSAGAKSSSSSKTGASKTSTTASKAGSKGGTAKASTASARGGSKTSTGAKSGAAGKRTASGGAKQSAGKSNSGGSIRSKNAGKSGAASKSAGGSTAARASAKKTTARASASKSAGASQSSKKTAKADQSKPGSKKAGNGILASAVDTISQLFAASRPNAIDLLKADHEVVNRYFEKIKADEDANHRDTYKNIKFELDAHAHIEETIFYPYMIEKGDEELKKIVLEGIEEHRQVKLFLAELSDLHGDNDRFKAKLKVLMEDVEHHVDEEEDEMFPLVEDLVPREVLETLGTQMEKEKARFQKMTAPREDKVRRASTRG